MARKKPSMETKNKISLAQRGYHNSANTEFMVGHITSEEIRRKISITKTGNTISWMKGKHHSVESNEANRLAHTGKKASEETKLRMRVSQLKRYQANPELASYRVVALRHSEEGGTGYISKNQRLLFNFLKVEYPDAVLELPIVTDVSVRYADIGVPSKRIDYEYDSQLHKKFKSVEKDAERDAELRRVGWGTIRFTDVDAKRLVGGRVGS